MAALLPKNISFFDWACQIRIDLPAINFPIPESIESWREWACQVVNGNRLNNIPLPTLLVYPNNDDWKKWASYFVSTLYN